MRIVYVLHGYPPHHNAGAETMAHGINRWLASRGHDVTVLARNSAQAWEGIKVRRRGPARWLERELNAADVVITHLDETPIAEAAARKLGRPLVHVLHNDRQLTFHHVTYAALIVANTAWVAARIPASLEHVPAVVVHPPTLGVEALPNDPKGRDSITLVNLLPGKGVDLFYALSELLPERRFLGVTGAYGRQTPPPPSRPNLVVRPNRVDMAPVWARTRLYLQPSDYESFGKAAVEAMAHGIPVIAHPTPGLDESLGDAGVFRDRNRIFDWVEAITELDHDKTYQRAAAHARQRATELEAITIAQLEAFEAELERLT